MKSSERSARLLRLLPLALLLLAPTMAQAHVGVGAASGFLPGVIHPITGLDHTCAMLAVGLWAAQRGGRALWLVPLTFVAVMALGGLLGMAAISLPFVEKGIVASVLIFGVFIAAAVRLPLVASVIIVGLFAIFTGTRTARRCRTARRASHTEWGSSRQQPPARVRHWAGVVDPARWRRADGALRRRGDHGLRSLPLHCRIGHGTQ